MSLARHRRPLPRSLAAACVCAIVLAASRAAAAQSLPQWQVDVGYDRLVAARGPATPVGVGVLASMVEAPEGGVASNYMPVVNSPEFLADTDPGVPPSAVTFTPGHVGAATVSNHSNGMAHWFVGNASGLSKATTSVTMYEANRWLNDIVNYGGSQAPQAQNFAVQNHSWVHDLGSTVNNLSALRRFDYMIETGNMTAVVGANNNNDSDSNSGNGVDNKPNPGLVHPPLLVSSYNAIVVGSAIGYHSRGTSSISYGTGRYRPDLVAPAYTAAGTSSFTSIATARTSSAAGVIRGVLQGSLGDNSETTKAILMAGATKTEFANWVEPSTGVVNPWDRTPTRPLDDVFGAGELNIFNSYLMTVGGRHAGSVAQPAGPVAAYGWDYQDRKNDAAVGDLYYNFVVPQGSTAPELSIILAWNVKITDTNPGSPFVPTESLQNLDLALYDSTATFMGTLVDQSISTVDNVEHIYRTNLGPGTYTLRVSGAANWDYGLAWRMSTLFDQPDADFDLDGVVTGGDFLIWQRNLGMLVGAQHTDGDANGDGMVDRTDLALLYAGAVPPQAAAIRQAAAQSGAGSAAAGSVPEPATHVVAAAAAILVAVTSRQPSRRRGA